ncbi:MAG TPA: LysM peptidoglycan-binding domain-containing protein [Gammaproteobacteria bacterium]|nr:LysM peptidoglycan-binding domain-containing protein [Gammaproteobacteria bacterium]
MSRARRAIVAVLAASATVWILAAAAEEDQFPRPADLEPAVQFWTRVYTEIDTHHGFIHDDLRLDVVFQTIEVADNVSPRERRRRVEHSIDTYEAILAKLGSGARDRLSDEEQRVLELYPAGTPNAEFKAAAQRVRFQLGQSDRFRAGLVRSGTWKSYIYDVLDKHGLPRELAALPHVESSFDPTAYSKVGAAGMWQFTRSTGARYMQIDRVVDERRDPFLATDAAARLLADNFSVVQTWPLALTAYNHGLEGMRRAVAQQGTTDIATIVKKYQSKSFQFASRNFYTAFLAALEIDTHAEKYFPGIDLRPPSDTAVVVVPDFVKARKLADALNVRESELHDLNPALTDGVWNGDKYVPKGFPLRVSRATAAVADELLAALDKGERYAAQVLDNQYRVRSGDTLSQIAADQHVSLAALMRVNNLSGGETIHVGQVISLPVGAQGGAPVATLLASTEPEARPPVSSTVPAGAPGTYTVRSGDSIEKIAKRLKIGQQALLAANSLSSTDKIFAGQTLLVPGTANLTAAAVLAANEPPASVALVPAAAVVVAPATSPFEGPLQEDELEAALTPADEGKPSGAETVADAEDATADNALAGTQVELAADPSDYSVSASNQITVQALETLGHYADWLDLPTQRLRDLNHIKAREAVVIGQPLKLDFSKVDAATFEQRRRMYQQQRQDEFFAAYQIEDVASHVIKPGESLWVLAERTYKVPVWLLRQYNPDLNLDRVTPGAVVKFPKLRAVDSSSAAQPAPVPTVADREN